ncbi:response regulator, partial [Acinetobacter baumannii]
IMLPGQNGLELCKIYRESMGSAPILMISAKEAIGVKERAFELGADDYITKPFHLKELSMRVTALLRRGSLHTSQTLSYKDLVVDLVDRQ